MPPLDWIIIGVIIWGVLVGLILAFFAGAKKLRGKDDE